MEHIDFLLRDLSANFNRIWPGKCFISTNYLQTHESNDQYKLGTRIFLSIIYPKQLKHIFEFQVV